MISTSGLTESDVLSAPIGGTVSEQLVGGKKSSRLFRKIGAFFKRAPKAIFDELKGNKQLRDDIKTLAKNQGFDKSVAVADAVGFGKITGGGRKKKSNLNSLI